MPQSTKSRVASKPRKPYPDYPLNAHATRRWAKRIGGKVHYLGPWDNPDAALQLYLDQRDDSHAGRTPTPAASPAEVEPQYVCNAVLDEKERLLNSGELSPRRTRATASSSSSPNTVAAGTKTVRPTRSRPR